MARLRAIPNRTGAGVRSNAGLRNQYQDKLRTLVKEMSDSVTYWLMAEYKRQQPRVEAMTPTPTATDASPVRDMLAALRKQMRRWSDIYDAKADAYAKWFASRANATATASTKSAVSNLLGFTVGNQMSRNVNNCMQGIIAENVGLIRSISSDYFRQIEMLVLDSVTKGRDIATLSERIQGLYGKTKSRADLIARDQNNKASGAIARARMQDAGVEYGVWKHSSVSMKPRESHLEADGTVFDLSKGLFLDGVWTWPGHEINCGCYVAPYLPRANERSAMARADKFDSIDAQEQQPAPSPSSTPAPTPAPAASRREVSFPFDADAPVSVAMQGEMPKFMNDVNYFPSDIAGVKRGAPMSVSKADTGSPNPNFSKVGTHGYRTNCQSCVVCYEARLRGYNVETLANTAGSKLEALSHVTEAAWIDSATGKTPVKMSAPAGMTTPKKYIGWLDKTIESDKRYTFEVFWKGYRNKIVGHIVHIGKDEKGKLFIYDPQTGKKHDEKGITEILSRASLRNRKIRGYTYDVTPKVLRVDNLSFNPKFMNDIMKRSSKA